jgi:hypothetical protein
MGLGFHSGPSAGASREGQERRVFPRVPMSFEVANASGNRMEVSGNVSAGGAMFWLLQPLKLSEVEIFIRLPAGGNELRMFGEVLSVHSISGRFAHRVRWRNPSVFRSAAEELVGQRAES